ncbi:MAG: type II toxin-antitoxin system VapC family toxin [Thermomicrobiales bacterium]
MICLDASVAVKLVLDEDWSDRVEALFFAAIETGESVIGTPLLPIEVTNILRQRMRIPGGLSRDEALERLRVFLGFPIEIHNPPWLHRQALVLADEYGLPAAYDAHYLALAEHFACPLWTDDRRLLRAIANRLPFVRPISEYNGSA